MDVYALLCDHIAEVFATKYGALFSPLPEEGNEQEHKHFRYITEFIEHEDNSVDRFLRRAIPL